MNQIEKYKERVKKINSLVCVGIDPDFNKIPKRFLEKDFPQFEFSKWIIEETNEYASAYKINSAFFESKGDKGIKELKMLFNFLVLNYGDIFNILDAKRGDIGNTNNGYIDFTYNFLNADSITLNPYLGEESLTPFLDIKEKVSIILCKTSNSGSSEFQNLKAGEKYIWQTVAERVCNVWNKNKNCMLVVGATATDEMKEIRNISDEMIFLVPGIGAQGGDLECVIKNGINKEKNGLIINSSRNIIFSDNPKEEAKKLRDSINAFL